MSTVRSNHIGVFYPGNDDAIMNALSDPADETSIEYFCLRTYLSCYFSSRSNSLIASCFRRAKIGRLYLSLRGRNRWIRLDSTVDQLRAANENPNLRKIELEIENETTARTLAFVRMHCNVGDKPIKVILLNCDPGNFSRKKAMEIASLKNLTQLMIEEPPDSQFLFDELSKKGHASLKEIKISSGILTGLTPNVYQSLAAFLVSEAARSIQKFEMKDANPPRGSSTVRLLESLSHHNSIQTLILEINSLNLVQRQKLQVCLASMSSLEKATIRSREWSSNPTKLLLGDLRLNHSIKRLELLYPTCGPLEIPKLLDGNYTLQALCLYLHDSFPMTSEVFANICTVIQRTSALKALMMRANYLGSPSETLNDDHPFYSMVSTTSISDYSDGNSYNPHNCLEELHIVELERTNFSNVCTFVGISNSSLKKLSIKSLLSLGPQEGSRLVEALGRNSNLQCLRYRARGNLLESWDEDDEDENDEENLNQHEDELDVQEMRLNFEKNASLEELKINDGLYRSWVHDLQADVVLLRNLLQHEIDHVKQYHEKLPPSHLAKTLEKIRDKCPDTQRGTNLDNACNSFQLEFINCLVRVRARMGRQRPSRKRRRPLVSSSSCIMR